MPGIPPVLTQQDVVDYSFMEIKNLKELIEDEDPEEAQTAEGSAGTEAITKLKNMTSIRISSNEIADMAPLYKYLDMVVEDADKLQWLDLSYNKIPRIGLSLEPFKNVSVLYLQANQISAFADLKPLASLTKLSNLALHGNPVAAKKHYRNYVIHLLPGLLKLDFSCITKKERVNSQTWAQIFRKKLKGKKEEE
mmetsp:Transcript_23290/g.46364  ORF Transcript_23290/g.46364 Transcript_23290/m.46364 type:complete len:194 (+) Transcript_23290:187-768(+)